jgi:hypothetical protein
MQQNLFTRVLSILLAGLVGLVEKYIRAVSTTKILLKINHNVPLALKIMTTGYIWPIGMARINKW